MNKKKLEKKGYGLSLSKNLVNRLHFIKKLEKGNIDISKELTPLIYDLIEKLEKEASIQKDTWYKNRKCSKCDSYLVLKTGKRGDFYDCYSYPKCKNTESIQKKEEK